MNIVAFVLNNSFEVGFCFNSLSIDLWASVKSPLEVKFLMESNTVLNFFIKEMILKDYRIANNSNYFESLIFKSRIFLEIVFLPMPKSSAALIFLFLDAVNAVFINTTSNKLMYFS